MFRTGLAAAGLVALLALLATLNSGGYLYGAGDQAFYIPAVMRHLDGSLFPRDRVLIDSQDRLNIGTSVLAGAVRLTGVRIETLALAGFLATLAILFAGALAFGRSLFAFPFTVAAFGLALTLRHRVARTGANTLESYFHPRMLAFGVGVCAITSLLRGRRALAVALLVVAGALHTTTALFFAAWVGMAMIASASRPVRHWIVVAVAALVGTGVWLAWGGPLAGRFTRMDEAWVAVLTSKDYVFPHQWPAWAWVNTLIYPVLVYVIYRLRRRLAVATSDERAVVAGAVGLGVLLIAAVPLIEARVAIAVQLQLPRVLWLLDFISIAGVTWWLAEGAWHARSEATRRRAPMVVCALLLVASAGRGAYVKWVEHPERPVVQVGLPDDDWRGAMRWLASQPADAYVLADPGHAWRYGSSVRVAAGRDVFFEEVKDVSIAMYDRGVAMRAAERIPLAAGFPSMTPERARQLASRFGLNLLVTEQRLVLPLAWRNGRFSIYRLDSRQGRGMPAPNGTSGPYLGGQGTPSCSR